MARKRTLHDDDGAILYPNTITDCIYNPDGTTLTDTLGNADISHLGDGTITSAIVAVNQKRNELFQYVVDGKYLVATAISDRGVDTDVNAEFTTMRDNIRKLKYKVTNTWTVETPVPYGFSHGSAVEYNDVLHILGGKDSGTNHYTYDGYSWAELANLPYSFSNGSAVVLNNEIHILGGSSSKTNHYKWNGSAWTSVSALPYNLVNGSAVVLNNEIHILGGSEGKKNHYKYNGSSWVNVSTLPYDFYEGFAVVLNNEIHILGGSSSKTNHYKWNGSAWTSVSTLPYDSPMMGAVVYNDKIHTVVYEKTDLNSHYVYDGEEWHTSGTLPYEFYYGTLVVHGVDIRILGGTNDVSSDISDYKFNYFYFEEPSTEVLPKLQTKFIKLSNSVRNITVFPDEEYDALSQVTTVVACQEKSVDTETLLNNDSVEVVPDDDLLISYVKVSGPELISPTITQITPSNPEFIIPKGYHTGDDLVDIECYTKPVSIKYGLLEVTPDDDRIMTGVDITGPVNMGRYVDTLCIGHESVSIPEGYHAGDGYINIEPETRDVTVITDSETIYASSGKVISAVNVTGPAKAPSNQVSENITTNDKTVYIGIPTDGYYTTQDTITTSIEKFGNNALTVDNVPYKNDLKLVSGLCNDRGIYSNTETFVDLPYSLRFSSAVVYRNQVHIMGGETTAHYVFNNGSWNVSTSLPFNVSDGAFVVYNDEIHLLGNDIYGYYTKHYKFNGTSWTEVSTLPYEFACGGAVVYDGKIHIMGTSRSSVANLYHYAWDGHTWTRVSTLPVHFYNGSAVVYNNEIHILGGSITETEHYRYIPSTNTWESVSTLPYEFSHGGAVVYNDEIHILGSYKSNTDEDSDEVWERNHYKWNGVMWTKVSTLPAEFYSNPALVYDDDIWVLGYKNYDTRKGRCIIHFESILQKLLKSTITTVDDTTKIFASV